MSRHTAVPGTAFAAACAAEQPRWRTRRPSVPAPVRRTAAPRSPAGPSDTRRRGTARPQRHTV